MTIDNVQSTDSNKNAYGIYGSGLLIKNNLHISNIEGKKSIAIYATAENSDKGISINPQNKNGSEIQISGDILAEEERFHQYAQSNIKSSISIYFNGNTSYLTGSVNYYTVDSDSNPLDISNKTTASKIDLSFSNSSKWNVTENSRLNSLTANSGSMINLSYNDPSTNPHHKTIKTETLSSDNGWLIFDVEDNSSDQIVAKEANGQFNAEVHIKTANPPSENTKLPAWVISQESGTLTVGEVKTQAGGVGSYGLKFFEDNSETGSLSSTGNAGKWYVVAVSDKQPPEITDPSEGTDKRPPEVTDNSTIGVSASQAVAWLNEKEDLRKRLGEMRYGAPDGAWVRVDSRKEKVNSGFEQNSYGIHLDADRLVARNNESSWLIGGALRYANSDQDSLAKNNASGELDQYSAKLYGTWMHENGSYVDLVGMLGYYEQDLKGKDNTGRGLTEADYSTYGFGLSAEAGHMFTWDSSNASSKSHWFVEPQAELSYFVSHGKDYKTTTGMAISQDNADFLNLRAGVVVGKTLMNFASDNSLQLALNAGINHEFLGDQDITYFGTDGVSAKVHASDMDGTRFYYGVMMDYRINDDMKLYAALEREEGDGYTKEFDVSAGMKISF